MYAYKPLLQKSFEPFTKQYIYTYESTTDTTINAGKHPMPINSTNNSINNTCEGYLIGYICDEIVMVQQQIIRFQNESVSYQNN